MRFPLVSICTHESANIEYLGFRLLWRSKLLSTTRSQLFRQLQLPSSQWIAAGPRPVERCLAGMQRYHGAIYHLGAEIYWNTQTRWQQEDSCDLGSRGNDLVDPLSSPRRDSAIQSGSVDTMHVRSKYACGPQLCMLGITISGWSNTSHQERRINAWWPVHLPATPIHK